MRKRFNKDELISRTGEIADAFSVFIAAGGNVAVWVLFICMIANIIDAAVNFPTVVSVGIMVIQAVVLDIAGFGLQTIAKRLLKVNDVEVQEAARKGKGFAGWLIFVMIVTMILITSKTLAPVVIPLFSKDTHLVGSIQNDIDIIDKVLVLARIGFTVAYVHTIHNLREIEADLQQEEEQQVQANDQLGLDNQKKIDTLAKENRDLRSLVTDLCTKQATLVDRVNDVCTKQAVFVDKVNDLYTKQAAMVDTSAKSVDIDVYTGRLERLEKMFSGLNVTVTEVNQNVLQITQNLYNMPGEQQYTDRLPAPRTSIVETPEEAYTDDGTEGLKALDMPSLDVPGVTDEKVKQVLALYLKGTKWREIPGNYSRTIKPVKEAYEAYLSTQVDTGEQECIQAVDTPVYAR